MEASSSNSRAQSMRQRFAHSRYPTSTSAQVSRKTASLLSRAELSALLAAQPRHAAYSLDAAANRVQHETVDVDAIRSPIRSCVHATGEKLLSPPSPSTALSIVSSPPSPPPLAASLARESRSPFANHNWMTSRLPVSRPSASTNCAAGRTSASRLPEPDAGANCCPHAATSVSPTQDRSTLHLPPSSKTNLSRRGLLANFKSKSLDLLGTSRIQHIQQQLQSRLNKRQLENELHPESGELASSSSVTPQSTPKTAERRRRLFLRKQTNSAPDSFESPVNSRSSSVESQCSIVYRGLESALRTSALFTWNSIESHTIPSNQPSFIECKSPP